jgi:hypothetical protein
MFLFCSDLILAQSPTTTKSPTTQQALTTQNTKDVFIYYRNKPRQKIWFKKMFQKCRDKITFVDGKYIDIVSPIDLDSANSYGKVPPIGTLVNAQECEVLQVLKKDEVLIRRPGYHAPPIPSKGQRADIWVQPRSPSYENMKEYKSLYTSRDEIIFAVKGLDTTQMVDGAAFAAQLVYLGPFKYKSAEGVLLTVPCYRLYELLTEEEFAKAIRDGFLLKDYRKVRVYPKNYETNDLISETNPKTKKVTYYKIVPHIVP